LKVSDYSLVLLSALGPLTAVDLLGKLVGKAPGITLPDLYQILVAHEARGRVELRAVCNKAGQRIATLWVICGESRGEDQIDFSGLMEWTGQLDRLASLPTTGGTVHRIR
jgi:hypothetical protein